MIVVDTTVLVYAVGAEHPLKEPCRKLISSRLDSLTTVHPLSDAHGLATDFLDGMVRGRVVFTFA